MAANLNKLSARSAGKYWEGGGRGEVKSKTSNAEGFGHGKFQASISTIQNLESLKIRPPFLR